MRHHYPQHQKLVEPLPDPPDRPKGGFGHSPKRLALEIGGGLAALVLLAWLALKTLGWLAGAAVGLVPTTVDEAIGEHTWEELAPKATRCTDPGPLQYVETLAAPILEQLDSPFTFRFAVVESEQINAFALPGGYVTVNMGLLNAAETGEEIAAVLAHEIIHVTQRHGTRRMARQLGGWVVLSLIFGSINLDAIIGAAHFLMNSAYDRDEERESDTLGRDLLLAAQIDPRGMETFFRRLEAEGGPTPPLILSSHPGSDERAETAAKGSGLTGPAIALPAPTGLKCK